MSLAQAADTTRPNVERRKAFTGAHMPVSDADARRRRPGTGVACLILLGITLGALGHVAVHLKHYEVALALGQARRERSALEERRRQLSLEIGVYKDPMRVMDVAREKLGLSQPSAADIVPAAQLRERLAMRAASPEPNAASRTSNKAVPATVAHPQDEQAAQEEQEEQEEVEGEAFAPLDDEGQAL